jgi:hypothetical protein
VKTLVAVLLTALITAGGTLAATGFTIHPGQGLHLSGTTIGCAAYKATSGTALTCSKSGSHIYVSIAPSAVVVTRNVIPATFTSAAAITQALAKGNVDLVDTWNGASQIGSKLDTLEADLSTAQTQLATAQAALTTVQNGGLAALEAGGAGPLMFTSIPALGAWFEQQGFDFQQTVDHSSGFASYTFQCDSCATG